MNRTFIRSTTEDGKAITCSWYDRNGRRFRIEVATNCHQTLTVRQTDDRFGFMPYAIQQGYTVIDDAPVPHPARIVEPKP